MGSLLDALGYPVDVFDSAEAYLASEHKRHTHCVIADVQMPNMTGIQLLHHLVAEASGIPVILITAFPQPETRDRVLRDGALGYLAKPVREESLIACVERALG